MYFYRLLDDFFHDQKINIKTTKLTVILPSKNHVLLQVLLVEAELVQEYFLTASHQQTENKLFKCFYQIYLYNFFSITFTTPLKKTKTATTKNS